MNKIRGPQAGFGPDPSGGSGMHREHTHTYKHTFAFIYRDLKKGNQKGCM